MTSLIDLSIEESVNMTTTIEVACFVVRSYSRSTLATNEK